MLVALCLPTRPKRGRILPKEQTQTSDQSNRETLKSKATELTQEAKQRGKQQLKAAADQAQKVAGVIEQASAELGRHDQQTLARSNW